MKSSIVVGWRGFTREDWVELSTYSAFVRAFHNRSLTRFLAMYLRFVHGVPYRELYNAIIDDFQATPFVVDASKGLFVKACFEVDSFYRELSSFLTARFPKPQYLKARLSTRRTW